MKRGGGEGRVHASTWTWTKGMDPERGLQELRAAHPNWGAEPRHHWEETRSATWTHSLILSITTHSSWL